jgi:RHS repeat-associated protein
MFFRPLLRWLRHTWLAHVPLIFRSAILRGRRSTKSHPERFPKIKLVLESLETRQAPQNILAAAAPFAVVGLLAPTPLREDSRPLGTALGHEEQASLYGDTFADTKAVDALFARWQGPQQALAAADTWVTDAGLATQPNDSVISRFQQERGKIVTQEDEQAPGHSAPRPATLDNGNQGNAGAGSGGGSADTHTPEVRPFLGAADPGTSTPPTAPDRNALTAFLDSGLQSLANLPTAAPASAASSVVPGATQPGVAPPPSGHPASADIQSPTPSPGSALAGVQQGFGQASLSFVPNVGQVNDAGTQFMVQHAGFSAFLSAAGATTFVVPAPNGTGQTVTTRDAFRMSLVAANANPTIVTGSPLPGYNSYFLGNDPTVWQAEAPNYSSVTYQNVYPGIDLTIQADASGRYEYAFQVAAGADPSQIQIAWAGLSSTSIDPNTANLILTTPDGQVLQSPATAYEVQGVTKTSLGVQQVLSPSTGNLSFQVSGRDPNQALIIDPTISYSTYLGGSGNDDAYAVAVSTAGAAFVTGTTASTNFPASLGSITGGTLGSTNVFITKVSPSGAIDWSTLIGGTNATGDYTGSIAKAIALDPAGNIYVVGTAHNGYPTVNPISGQSFADVAANGFVSEVGPAGNTLLFSTPINLNQPGSGLNGVAVDQDSMVYVIGTSGSGATTTTGTFQSAYGGGTLDAWVAKINPAASAFAWASFLGGSANDSGAAIALDRQGNPYVGGSTYSSNFPVTTGAYDTTWPGGTYAGYVTEIASNGTTLIYSTFLGSNSGVAGVAVDYSGNTFVTGSTSSATFPQTSGAFSTSSSGGAFVTKLPPGGASLSYSGVIASAAGAAIGVDISDSAYATGTTTGSFPVTSDAFQSTYGGATDAFALEVNPAGTTITYGSYLGGNQLDAGTGIGVDNLGSAVIAGYTASTNFPTYNAAQTSNGGGYDAFVSRLLPVPAPPTITTITPDTGKYNNDQITNATTITLYGKAVSSAGVSLYRNGVGLLGTTTAGTSGLWTFSYTGTVLPQGVTSFYATDSNSAGTSKPSADFLVTVDLTPPTINVSVPSSTYSLGPQVLVTASDDTGIPTGTTVTLDLTQGGTTTLSYATGTLTNGQAIIKLPTLPAIGTYSLAAHVTDLAGNVGTSTLATFTVANNPSPWVPGSPPPWILPGGPSGWAMARLAAGDVSVNQPLDFDLSPGTSQGGSPELVYNSDWINVKPFVQVNIPTDTARALPPSITATLIFNGVTQTAVTYTVGSGISSGDGVTLALQDNTALTGVGAYPWTVLLSMNYPTPILETVSSTAYVPAQDGSPFGSGWTLSTVDQLATVTGGVLRTYGGGGWTFYSSLGGGSFQSEPWDNGTLSQPGGAGTTYTYTTPDGQTWTFNGNGYQTQWQSADGQQKLQYRYNGSNLLTGITAIDGALTTITYSGGLAQTIQEPNSKTVTLAYSGTNLTQITNPDGGQHQFSYDTTHHLTSETFGLLQNQWAYSNGALSALTWGSSSSPSVSSFTPGLTVGLTALTAGTVWATLTDPNSNTTRYQLDSSGRVVQQIAPDGGTTTYGYSQASGFDAYLTSVTDPLGRTTTFARDSAGYVTQETLPDGKTVNWSYQSAYHALTQYTDPNTNTSTYAYDNSTGHLTSTTDPLGNPTTITWTGSGLVQSVTDANNHTTTYNYDTSRRLTVTIDPGTYRTTLSYDNNGNPLTVTDANNHTATLKYDNMNRLTATLDALSHRTTATYDVSGLPLTYLDELGHKTSYVYDGFHRGLVAQVFEAVGTSVQRITQASYDANGNATLLTDAMGNPTTQSIDDLNRVTATTNAVGGVTESQYDLAGQLTGTRDELGRWTYYADNKRGWVTTITDHLSQVTTLAYDGNGNTTKVTDALTHATLLGYDKLDRLTLTTDPLTHTTSQAFDKVGNLTASTDANGNQATYAYDVLDRLTALTAAAGTSVAETTTANYDPVGNLTATTDGNGNQTTFAYDAINRQTAMTAAAGTSIAQTTTTGFDAASNVTTTTDGLNKTTSYGYDALNRQTTVTDPLSHTTTTILDLMDNVVATLHLGNPTRDPLGNLTRIAYDDVYRPITSVDALGGVNQALYDAAGNVRAVIDSVSNETSYVYDALNRQVQSTDPLGHTNTTGYNAVSDVTSITDRLGRTITYAYDAGDRLTASTWLATGGTMVLNTQQWSYDNNGNLTSAGDNYGTYTLNYDPLNRLTSQTDLWGLTLTMSYDKADNRTLMTDSKGGVLTSVYDALNRLASRQLSGNGMQLRIDTGYDARNELTSLTRYGTTGTTMVVGTTSQAYDAAGRVTAITNFNGSAATISYYNDSYDAADRVTQEVWGSGSTTDTHTYGYDATDQLTSADGTTYSYDHNGNRTMSGYTTGTNNQLTSDGTWTYTYDAEGNLIQKVNSTATWTYGYDNLDRLVSVQEVTTTGTQLQVTYVYDIFNNRVEEDKWKASTGTTATLRHAFDDQGNIWADVTTTGMLLARYVYGDGVDQIWARAIPSGLTNAGVTWYITDRLGSVRDLMDNSGTIQDHIDYDGFGKVSETNSSFGDSRKFTGREFDYDTGLQYNRARYYDPATGRWVSEDPMGFGAGDGNLYRYISNQSTNATDPNGEDVWLVHGVRDTGYDKPEDWYTQFKDKLQEEWKKRKQEVQDVHPVTYEGSIREALNTLLKKLGLALFEDSGAFADLELKHKTTLFAATTKLNIDKPTPAVNTAADRLAEEIKDAFKAGKTINLFGHSNGTMVILWALKKLKGTDVKVDNLVLAASPFDTRDEDNVKALDLLIKDRVKGTAYFHWSESDLVTDNAFVGGGRFVPTSIAPKIWNVDASGWIQGPEWLLDVTKKLTGHTYRRTLDAHTEFVRVKCPSFSLYVDELAGAGVGRPGGVKY